MTYTIICPRCQRETIRSNTIDRPTRCSHQYHAPENCDICLECRTGWTPQPRAQEQP